MVLDPLEMSPEEADAIFGKPLMDALRERKERPRMPNKYVQLVEVKPRAVEPDRSETEWPTGMCPLPDNLG
jgi:hypothetical protein